MRRATRSFIVLLIAALALMPISKIDNVPILKADFDPSWPYRVAITIDADQVDSDLTDFPVFLDLADLSSDFFTNVNSDGSDIRVTISDGETEVAREVVNIDTGGETGELFFQGDISSSVDTTFYVYYGNAAASEPAVTDANGRNGVWADYEAVWHFEQNPSSEDLLDSTGNGYDLTPANMELADRVTGTLGGRAWEFNNDATGEYALGDQNSTLSGNQSFFLETIMYVPSTASPANSYAPWIFWGNTSTGQSVFFGMYTAANKVLTGWYSQGQYQSSTYSYDTWHHVQWNRTGGGSATTGNTLYIDGASQAYSTWATGTPNVAAAPYRIYGTIGGFVRYLDSSIDEQRVHKGAVSTAWANASYENMMNPGTFYTVGSHTDLYGPITWDGDTDLDWCTPTNWSSDTLPTDADDVNLDVAATITTSGCSAGDIDFATLTIGGSNATILRLNQDLGTANNIIIANNGVFEQYTTDQVSISGDLTVESGGVLRHGTNTTSHLYSLNISAVNIDIQTGGSLNLDSRGYDNDGGPGKGISSSNRGSGGANGGDGGSESGGQPGGVAYCDLLDLDEPGSGGGNTSGGSGGGLAILNATGTVTLDGTITADGGAGGGTYHGGGAGGSISITADIIDGTPDSFTATGGSGAHSTISGAGGGGCVSLFYTTSTAIDESDITINGATAGIDGGGGLIFIKDTDSGANGDLTVKNTSSAQSTQGVTTLTVDTISAEGGSIYSVPLGKTLSVISNDPFLGDTSSEVEIEGTLNALSATTITGSDVSIEGGTFNNSVNLSSISTNGGLLLDSSATMSTATTSMNTSGLLTIYEGSFETTDLTISGGTTTFNGYTTATDSFDLDDLIISGGTLTHGANTTTQANILNISANNVDVQVGGTINLDSKGYQEEAGPGAGARASNRGSGGAHAGDGGLESSQVAGGVGYCDVLDIDTIGSGGGYTSGGHGGGLLQLTVAGTLNISGTITADGGIGATYQGGGGGGGVKLVADTITGTPTSFTVTGGNGGDAGNAGAGGGGCVSIEYTTANSLSDTNITVNGGTTGYQKGGAGYVYILDVDSGEYGDLYVDNANTTGAQTTQAVTDLTIETITFTDRAIYNVPSGSSITLNDSEPFLGDDANSELEIEGTLNALNTSNILGGNISIEGGTFNNSLSGTLDVGSNAGLSLNATSTVSNVLTTLTTDGALVFYYGTTMNLVNLVMDSGTTTLYSYSVSSPLSLTNLIINGGILTNGSNTTAQSNVINIEASTIDIGAGGTVSADSKGYRYESGPGPGARNSNRGSGGAHGGNGGAESGGTAGGTAYCDIDVVDTMGSGGGNTTGGYGGGLIWLIATSTIDIDGTITADGGVGGSTYHGGGGGGAIKLAAPIISGTPTSVTATGGNGGSLSFSGGGGGGCIRVEYVTSSVIDDIGDVNVNGGTGLHAGTIGLFSEFQDNTAPSISTALASVGQNTDGSGYYTFTFSVDDPEDNDIDVQVECGDGSYADIDLASTSHGSLNNAAATYQITGIDTSSGAVDITIVIDTQSTLDDIDTSTFQCRVTPFDGIDTGTSSAVTGLDLDNEDPDPNVDATVTLVTDLNSDGVAAVGDTMQLTAGTENTGDTVTWQLNLTPITGQATLAAGIESDPIIAGALEFTDVPVNFNVVDDMGNEADAVTANTVSLDQILPVFTDNGTLSISTDNNSDGIAGISDGLTLTGVTLDSDDDDVITIDYDTVGGLLRVLMDSEGIVGSGAVDGATTFNITAMDDAGNTATTTSDAINVYNVAHTVEFDITSSTVSETDGDTDVTIVLDAVSGVDVTVDYTVTGTATNTEDFTLVDGTVTIDAGNASADINIPLIDDGDVEDAETIILTLSNPGEATLDTNTVHTITVTSDDNTAPTISTALADDDQGFSVGAQANDGSGYYYFTFSVDDAEDENVDVQVECGDGSYADIDIVSVSVGTLDNDAATYQITGIDTSSGAVDVELVIDTQSTLDDTRTSSFQCRVTPFDGTHIGTASAVTGLTMDNEPPVITDSGTITLETDNNSNGIVNVGDEVAYAAGSVSNTEDINSWSVDGTGFVESPSYILAGGGNRTVIEGSIDDATHTFIVTVTDDFGNASTATSNSLNIDNEPPVITDSGTVSITTDNNSDGIASISDGLTLTGVTVNSDDSDVITVDFGVVGGLDEVLMGAEDFVGTGSVNGSTTFNIDVTDNSGNITSFTSNAINIYNIAHTVQFAESTSTVSETDGTTAIMIELDAVSGVDITVDYAVVGGSAVADEDYTLADGTFIIEAGDLNDALDVILIDDDNIEDLEDITIQLSNPSEATLGANTNYSLNIESEDTSGSSSPSRINRTRTGTLLKDPDEEKIDDRRYPHLENHWAEEQLTELINKGIIDKNVQPDAFINREEAVRIVLETENIDFDGSAIEAALELGIIEQARPEDPATRAEILKIIFNTLELRYFGTNPSSHFSDVFLGNWFFVLINFAFEHAIVQGYSDGSFKPNQIITAAEVAVLLSKTLDAVE